ncbi:hypothetical protein P0136_11640 [Lentisphaerota bacterium ZTH]|nr:hypothetical protein JYG24_10840 [Lentisphaerota bacterium]WET06009.1 hypothetical protein P0136_11640 [Lentisphaerota bacterium ZTH]
MIRIRWYFASDPGIHYSPSPYTSPYFSNLKSYGAWHHPDIQAETFLDKIKETGPQQYGGFRKRGAPEMKQPEIIQNESSLACGSDIKSKYKDVRLIALFSKRGECRYDFLDEDVNLKHFLAPLTITWEHELIVISIHGHGNQLCGCISSDARRNDSLQLGARKITHEIKKIISSLPAGLQRNPIVLQLESCGSGHLFIERISKYFSSPLIACTGLDTESQWVEDTGYQDYLFIPTDTRYFKDYNSYIRYGFMKHVHRFPEKFTIARQNATPGNAKVIFQALIWEIINRHGTSAKKHWLNCLFKKHLSINPRYWDQCAVPPLKMAAPAAL